MRTEERHLFGLTMAMLLLATVQGCGSASMDGELGPLDDPIGGGPNPGDSPDPKPDPDPDPDPDADPTLTPVAELQPELLMLSQYTYEAQVWGVDETDLFIAGPDGLLAHFDGTRWRLFENHLKNPTSDFESIFGFSSDDVYVASRDEGVLHYDGSRWSFVEALRGLSITDLWGSAPNDLYAVAGATLMHFDGFDWVEVASGLPKDAKWLALAGSGEKHVVLVGRNLGSPSRPRLVHFDGARWKEPPMPEVLGLSDVWSAGPKETYAVGPGGVILRFDGESLTQMESQTEQNLTRVHGAPTGEAFAVGRDVFLRLDGTTWSSIAMPQKPASDSHLNLSSVFALGADSVFTGHKGIHHFDGGSWKTELAYTPAVSDIWATGPEDVLFVGSGAHRYDGSSLERVDFGALDDDVFEDVGLLTAWGTEDRIFAAGDGGLFFYDGNDWGKLAIESDTQVHIYDMYGTSENDVFGVGYDGTVIHFDGATWRVMDSGTENTLVGVWASAPDDAYAVGYDGTVLHYDGDTWSNLVVVDDVDYLGITGFEQGHIVAPTHEDFVFFSDGVSWRPEPANDIKAIHGTAPDNLYGVGPHGLSHYDGESWTLVSRIFIPYEPTVFAVSPRDVYVAGRMGVIRYTTPGDASDE